MVKIIWTREAIKELQALITYLRSNWSKTVAEDFIGTLNAKLELLQDVPDTGVASYEYDKVRRLLIARNRVLYYLSDGGSIYILNVFDLLPNEEDEFYPEL